MRIEQTRECNLLNLQGLAQYLNCEYDLLAGFYNELLEDKKLIDGINERIENAVTEHHFTKGIFGKGKIDTLDWFAYQRVLVYVLIRFIKPEHLLETGVFYGGNTVFMLAAIAKNGQGLLHSVDLPDSKIRELYRSNENYENLARHLLVGDTELYDDTLSPGFLVPGYLRDNWDFIEGSSLDLIPKLNFEFDFYIHDSDHSFNFLNRELALALKKLSKDAIVIVDDLNWSNSFFKFCVDHNLYPLLATDNGKGNLLVRTGIVKLDHPYRWQRDITGEEENIDAQY